MELKETIESIGRAFEQFNYFKEFL